MDYQDKKIKSLETSNAEKDSTIADKDNHISELEAENAALRAELAKTKH
jgi:prefoldin subunit 5